MPKHNQIITDYFERLLAQHGPNYMALDWNSPESQEARFKKTVEIFGKLGRKNLTVLDLGSGLGDFYGYLQKSGVAKKYGIKYTGLDLSEKMAEAARAKYPQARFIVKDILEEELSEKYDVVVESGAFNLRIGTDVEHLYWVKQVVLKAWGMAKSAVVLNFLSQNAVYYVEEEGLDQNCYFYFRPEMIVEWARPLTGRFLVDHNYHVADFTVFLLK